MVISPWPGEVMKFGFKCLLGAKQVLYFLHAEHNPFESSEVIIDEMQLGFDNTMQDIQIDSALRVVGKACDDDDQWEAPLTQAAVAGLAVFELREHHHASRQPH
jgi:hypothetical protein